MHPPVFVDAVHIADVIGTRARRSRRPTAHCGSLAGGPAELSETSSVDRSIFQGPAPSSSRIYIAVKRDKQADSVDPNDPRNSALLELLRREQLRRLSGSARRASLCYFITVTVCRRQFRALMFQPELFLIPDKYCMYN